jgi:mycofactocin precursor
VSEPRNSATVVLEPTTEPEPPAVLEDEVIEEDVLVEDVSIDGMCGVY